ncbi:hypothetical protein [Kosmotoga pacifica]|uniref:Uncharacterized protein n=1 Tax=Kosmotoga pacifica TaxID=1330330 RepID=A0A0G2ZC81_9BACT|nr:hypothetical protein [Kosmotoga pacifica]AKI97696.1 hypothetical protein IX53_07570 [Kosmotoga pacifica]
MEKQDSFMKQFRTIEHEYRERLAEAKSTSEVGDIFIDYTLMLLKQAEVEVSNKAVEYIVFDPEAEVAFRFEKPLLDKLEGLFESSDLKNIIAKMAESAKHRYIQMTHDSDRTSMFRRHT